MYKKKPILIFVMMAMLILASGCRSTSAKAGGKQLLQALQEQVRFSTKLSQEDGSIYFPDLPADSTVVRLRGSGYFADELVLITLEKDQDFPQARQAVSKHLEELKTQFLSYIPEEVPKIEQAVVYETGNEILICITEDYEKVQQILQGGTVPSAGGETPSVHKTEPPMAETTVPTVPETTAPQYPVLKSKEGKYHDYGNNSIRVDNSAFELYGYSPSSAGNYTAIVNKAADALQGHTKVYALAIPTAVGVILPDDIAAILPSYTDQGAVIEKIYDQMIDSVIPVRAFQNMMAHRDEYLYFRTDYHWNGRGAYYAYEAFCQTKGIKPIPLEKRRKQEFGNFLGFMYTQCSGKDPVLKETPDTVEAFHPKSSSATMKFTDRKGKTYDWNIIMDVSQWESGSKYNTFAGSDNPIAEFTNPEVTDNSVCVVVKESYGNALLPYLVDHYHTIYEIDYRYWEGNIIDFAKEKKAEDLIFANNLTMISTDLLVGRLADNF